MDKELLEILGLILLMQFLELLIIGYEKKIDKIKKRISRYKKTFRKIKEASKQAE